MCPFHVYSDGNYSMWFTWTEESLQSLQNYTFVENVHFKPLRPSLQPKKKKKPRDVGKYIKSLTIHTLYTSKTCSKNMLCPFLVIRAKGEKRYIITCLTLKLYVVSLTWMKTFFKLWVSKLLLHLKTRFSLSYIPARTQIKSVCNFDPKHDVKLMT